MKSLGNAMARIDGPLKTTGVADYASDHHFPGMLYAVPVSANIAKGTLTRLEVRDAERMPGVHKVYHRENLPKIYRPTPSQGFEYRCDEPRPTFEDDEIRYHGQYIALVVADTFEQATAAAHAVKATYKVEQANVEPKMEVEARGRTPHERGEAAKAFDAAPVKTDEVYSTPVENHSAIELHGCVAVPEGDSFTLYETSQAIFTHRNVVAQQLGVGRDKVKVVTKYLGSGFGGKLWPWPFSALAATAARDMNRPIKLVLNRQQVFQGAGRRPRTQQRVRLSATPDGKLTSISHDYVSMASILDDYAENCGEATSYLYSCPNVKVTSGLARRNIGSPTSMRGPGAVPGLFALETALDELAVALKMDPLQLRIANEPKIDEGLKIPFSSRHLLECYEVGRKAFGWDRRTPEVGSMRQGDLILGWGVACAGWIAERIPAEAIVDLRHDGTARVACGSQDIGTGTYTMLSQIGGERLGLDPKKVEPVLGHTDLPMGPLSGGSMATASLVPAIIQAADNAIQALLQMATRSRDTAFSGKPVDQLAYTEGRVHLKSQPASAGMPFNELLKRVNMQAVTGSGKSEGTRGGTPTVSRHSYGVQFVEVTWDLAIARLRVPRIVTVIDAGRIANPKTARNQIEGGVVMGIGMGLFEETLYDHRNGALLNRNFADYVMAVNADAPRVDVHFLDYPDPEVNEYGLRGVGEIGLAGVAAALSNAVYHATGKRVRDLPITIEKLL
jgi:xanthine dehydrogenase YagR molybdenum-binding subunit